MGVSISSPTPNKTRKRRFSNMTDSNETNGDSSVAERISDIQTDLQAVENRLSSSHRVMAHGRAVFDSIGTALGRIRSRMQDIPTSSNGSEDSPAATSPATASIVTLTERLQTAERAHSARVPLGILQGQLARDEASSSSSTRSALSSRAKSQSASSLRRAVGEKEEQEGIQQHSSTLVASRRYAESQEENDAVLHEGLGIAKPFVDGPTLVGEMDLGDRAAVDELLSAPSMEKWDSSRNLDNNLESQSGSASRSTTNVYTWGGHGSMYRLSDSSDAGQMHEVQINLDDPRLVPANSRIGRSNVVSVALSDNYLVCATSTGGVLACGDNSEGAVDPSQRAAKRIERPMHLEILAMAQITQVSAGIDHVAALTETRSALTWGNNQDGQLGQTASSSKDRRFRPPAAMKLFGRRAAKVACGHRFTLVLTTRMEVLACGREEITGYSTLHGPPRLPKEISALEGLPLVHMAAGNAHAVVVTSNGAAYAWGANENFQCGRKFPNAISVPLPIDVGASAFPLSPGAIDSELGNPFSNLGFWKKDPPAFLADDVAVVDVACGGQHTTLCTRSGQLIVTCSNHQQQLGTTNPDGCSAVSILPHPTECRKFVSGEAGANHSLLLDDAGDVWHVGNDRVLQKVLDGLCVTMIAAGGAQNVAIVSKENLSSSTFKTSLGLEGVLKGILQKTEESDFSSQTELVDQTQELFR